MKAVSIREMILASFVAFFVATELYASKSITLLLVGGKSNDSRLRSNDSIQQQHELVKDLWNFNIPSNRTEIRRWGCNRTETPLIFVHIGKAGGGSVGARIGASCLNYTKAKPGQPDDSYYPLENGGKARFIASCYSTHLPSKERTYEGTAPCHASTPLGQAIGCPEILTRIRRFQGHRHRECDPFSNTCRLVYMGHNFFGSEMHWLPVGYLQKWWASLSRTPNAITPLWDKLHSNNTWCDSRELLRPDKHQSYLEIYETCSIPLQREVDTKAIRALTDELSLDDSHVITSWSPLYASLPLLRVTVMRDPFGWLVSKYFWHRREPVIENNSTCDNIEEAFLNNNGLPRPHELDMDSVDPGWISRMSLGYIMYLCGEDCIVRYAAGTATLADLEYQAESNLRQAFTVVGILEEVDTFYDMLTARVQYMDTSLNPQVKGAKHSTGRNAEITHCRERFQDPNFQANLLKRSPELRVINRLYQVAKEVNKFQLNELRQCSGGSVEDPASG